MTNDFSSNIAIRAVCTMFTFLNFCSKMHKVTKIELIDCQRQNSFLFKGLLV